MITIFSQAETFRHVSTGNTPGKSRSAVDPVEGSDA